MACIQRTQKFDLLKWAAVAEPCDGVQNTMYEMYPVVDEMRCDRRKMSYSMMGKESEGTSDSRKLLQAGSNGPQLGFVSAAVLCCAVLCCAVLCCAVLCCAVLCCAVLCCCAACMHRTPSLVCFSACMLRPLLCMH